MSKLVPADAKFREDVLANTNILSADYTPKQRAVLRIGVAVDTSGVFRIREDNGSENHLLDLNDGVALKTNKAYTFAWPVRPGLTYNFQLSVGAKVLNLSVEEAQGSMI